MTATLQHQHGEFSTLGVRDLLSLPRGLRWRSYVAIAFWLAVFALSIVTGLWMVASDLTALPLKLGPIEAYVTVYPPLALCTFLLFWMGFVWAIVPAYAATFVIAIYTGMPVAWAAFFAFSDTVGLAFLAIAYRSTGARFNVRDPGSIGFFVVAAFISALAGSTGSFVWSHTHKLSAVEAFAVWEGWWLGGFLQTLLICGPLLFLLTPAVARLKTRWFGRAVRHSRGAALLTVATLISMLLVCAFVVASAQLSRLRLEQQMREGYAPARLLEFASSALSNTAWMSAILVITGGLGFLALAARWSRELEQEVGVRTRLLVRSRTRTRRIIDLIPHMIFARDESGRFVLANKVTARTLGKKVSELENSGARALAIELPYLAALSRAERQVFASGEDSGETVEVIFDAAGDERRMRVARIMLDDDDEGSKIVLTVAVDVTEQEAVEAQLKELVDELADKNRELERFAYTISHDLKSPLVTIRGFSREVARQIQIGDLAAVEQDLGRIDNATSRMQKLLDGLLLLSRSGKLSGPKQPVDMNHLVSEVIEILHGQIELSSAEIMVDPGLPGVKGDPVRLFELVQNLLENAMKFRAPDRALKIRIGCDQVDGENHYYVEDNGRGVSPDGRAKIFSLFEQLESGDAGTGIGLSLAKRIIEIHGGRIWVEEARTAAGARFVFVLPPAEKAVSFAEDGA